MGICRIHTRPLWLAGGYRAHRRRWAALISFMAARTFMSGSMSVTRVWMIMKPKEVMAFRNSSITSAAMVKPTLMI